MKKLPKKNLMLDLDSDISLEDSMEPSTAQSFMLDPEGITFKEGDIRIHKLGIVCNQKGHRIDITPTDFEPLEIIGKGGCGIVQKAYHKPSGLYFASKFFNIFEREKRHQLLKDIGIQFSHHCKNLVKCYGAFYTDGYVALILEYMDLGSLAIFIQRFRKIGKTIPEPILASLIAQILRGLWHLHKRLHQIHRDLKPENILINSLGEVKLADFGISKALVYTAGLCETFIGTTKYMSPERIAGKQPYSFPSDVWSLGIIAYELATGEYPYVDAKSPVVLYECIVNSKEPRLFPGKCSPGLCDFVECCLKKHPAERWSVTDLIGHQWIVENELSREQCQEWVLSVHYEVLPDNE